MCTRQGLARVLALALASAASVPAAGPASPSAPGRSLGIAVVELFTSEGCSSCPPADRLLRELADEAAAGGQRVFALSFHVDYWNDLGWADPFSRPAFSERQRAYADVLGGGVYTPEMIVNGRTAFVGSDAARARREARRGLARPAAARFGELRAAARAGNIQVTFAVAGEPPGALIRMALVLPDTSVPVRGGENGGRKLAHHNVVLAFGTVRADASGAGEGRLPMPPGARPEALRVIAYAQEPESLAIVGAGETGIGGEGP